MDKENETSETGAIRREKILRENGVQLQIRKKIKEEISFLPDVRLYYRRNAGSPDRKKVLSDEKR